MSEADPWAALGRHDSADQLCSAWLVLLARRVPGLRAALVLLPDADGAFVPAAAVPPTLDATYLGDTARQALHTGNGVRTAQADGGLHVAYPLGRAAVLGGLVVADLQAADDNVLSGALQDLHWGAGWLLDLISRRGPGAAAAHSEQRLEQALFLLDLQAALLSQSAPERAAFEFVNRLARRYQCQQVLHGSTDGARVRMQALSSAAQFDARSDLVRLAEAALEEACDQGCQTVHPAPVHEAGDAGLPAVGVSAAGTTAADRFSPTDAGTLVGSATASLGDAHGPPADAAGPVTAALRRSTAAHGAAAGCTVLLQAGDGRFAGACLLLRDHAFTSAERRSLQVLGAALGPALAQIADRQESLWAHTRRSSRALAGRLVDGSHPGLKLAALPLAAVLAAVAFWPVPHRVNARAVLEGSVQRAAVAPFAGFIRDAPARAGDTVRMGQVLATLDDRELRLEHERWQAELAMADKREREARANGERAELRLASAQVAQARAQLDLAQNKLARVQVIAPFDGIVVRGDLSQQLGSPVELGKVLFELAPLQAWRVILRVDERDIGRISEQRAGELVLTSMPNQRWPLRVSKITPIAVAEEGVNTFRVEAELAQAGTGLRPGMEGVAKVEAEPRSLLWIWTHRFTDWLALARWRWWL